MYPYLSYVPNLALEMITAMDITKGLSEVKICLLYKILVKKSLPQLCHIQENEKILTTQFSTAKRFAN